MNLEIALDKTESFLQDHKEDIPTEVFNFMAEVCRQERQMIEMLKQQSRRKTFKMNPVNQ
jgi:hypothetical protein